MTRRTTEEIVRMFEAMGLGTEAARSRFKGLGVATEPSLDESLFVRLDDSTQVQSSEGEDAELA